MYTPEGATCSKSVILSVSIYIHVWKGTEIKIKSFNIVLFLCVASLLCLCRLQSPEALCFQVVRPSVRPCVRVSVRPCFRPVL